MHLTPPPSVALLKHDDPQWGWGHRGALASLLVPVAIHALGVAWPLLHIQTFEKSFRRIQRTMLAFCVLARLAEVYSAQPWVHTDGFVNKAFIFDAMVLVINQARESW